MYDEYYEKYMRNMVSPATLAKLVAARKLTQEQVDTMVGDRLDKYGY